MKRGSRHIAIAVALLIAGCGDDWAGAEPYDVTFEIPRTEAFAPSLTAYGLYAAPMASLRPAAGAVQYELASELFTDYALKQRLVRLPAGATVTADGQGRLVFPEGTVLAKTFYYPDDLRAPDGPRRVIETRLLVKREGTWNVATYLWNAEQTDATLLLEGAETPVSWTDADGRTRSTRYAVPHEGQCVTCHQSEGASAYIGPALGNLDRPVERDGEVVDQLAHLAEAGVLPTGLGGEGLPSYRDEARSLAARARAYLHINCAHCHQPGAWGDAARRQVDFRYSTALAETGIARKAADIRRALESGEMPYLGTTVLDEAGVRLVIEYLDGL